MGITKKAYKQKILDAIETNDKAVIKALFVLYDRQTKHEQDCEDDIVRNGVGFTIQDVHFLTSIVKFYERNGYLTGNQMRCVRNRVKHYLDQLFDEAVKVGKALPPRKRNLV